MKLTDEQIELAAKASWDQTNEYFKGNLSFDRAPDFVKYTYREAVIAIAPFVQIAWDEPTQAELNGCVFATLAKGNKVATGLAILQEFVAMRNALYSPAKKDKSKDARIALLVDLFHKNHPTMMGPESFAKEILELLDRKE